MWTLIAGAWSGLATIVSSIFGWKTEVAKADATAETEDAGAAKAEAETIQVIAEKADAQAHNNAASRSVDAIADRLLHDADASAQGGDRRG